MCLCEREREQPRSTTWLEAYKHSAVNTKWYKRPDALRRQDIKYHFKVAHFYFAGKHSKVLLILTACSHSKLGERRACVASLGPFHALILLRGRTANKNPANVPRFAVKRKYVGVRDMTVGTDCAGTVILPVPAFNDGPKLAVKIIPDNSQHKPPVSPTEDPILPANLLMQPKSFFSFCTW